MSAVQYEAARNALLAIPTGLEQQASGGLDELAQRTGAAMREKAPKFRTRLANSVNVFRPGPLVREVRPTVAQAPIVEEGVKPGGKGLPRYFDPRNAAILDWLRSKAFAGARTPRLGSVRRQTMELELRDRYHGLAWHIRHKGTKAQPYVGPAFDLVQPLVQPTMDAALARAIDQAAE